MISLLASHLPAEAATLLGKGMSSVHVLLLWVLRTVLFVWSLTDLPLTVSSACLKAEVTDTVHLEVLLEVQRQKPALLLCMQCISWTFTVPDAARAVKVKSGLKKVLPPQRMHIIWNILNIRGCLFWKHRSGSRLGRLSWLPQGGE